jgi:RND family efflux transporter MFP subunit
MSIGRNENPACRRRLLLLGGCAVLSMLLGADEPAPGKIVLEVRGYIVPVRQVSVSPKVAGEVVESLIEEGQKVQRGDVLARLDRAGFEAELRLARARLKLAEILAAEAKRGAGQPSIAAALAKVEIAKAEVGIAELRLDGCTVRAPASGTVLVKRAEVGTRLDPRGATLVNATVCELADLQALDVEVFIPEQDIPRVEKGQRCSARSRAYPRVVYRGRVTRFLPVADRAKGCIAVRVRLELPDGDDQLRPDLGMTVKFFGKE